MSFIEPQAHIGLTTEQDIAEKERLISKGQRVLELCIQQEKLLCVQGFVDSQIERGGVYLEVVVAMRDFLSNEIEQNRTRSERGMLRELHGYVEKRLETVTVEETEDVA